MTLLVAVDTGGTFTDFVAFDRRDGRVTLRKALTRYDNLVEGVLSCADDAGLKVESFASLKYGSTHVINALLQRTGAKAALVTTRGHRDMLYLRRCGRPRDFDLHFQPEPPLIPRSRTIEIGGRVAADGTEESPLDPSDLDAVVLRLQTMQVDAVAVSLLNSYANDVHERTVASHLRRFLPEVYVTTGSELSREWFEYERTSTAAANAFVGPSTRLHLERFRSRLACLGNDKPFYLMASHGGVLTVDEAARAPVALVESGPVGGCIGASVYASALGLKNVVAFDMGGTTAKCALVESGRFDVQSLYHVGGPEAGLPIRANVIDIVEVGAGGGSIASVDPVGRLSVGPRSAGAEPGPVSFRRGGLEPTVTDANVVLGRIAPSTFMGGTLNFDVQGAAAAVCDKVARPLGYTDRDLDRVAQGILTLAVLTMSGAVREITIERGRDVRDYDLFVFGGGGPLHAGAIARELSIPRIIVPPEPGNFSALGMLLADARVDSSQTIVRVLNEGSATELTVRASEMLLECEKRILEQFGLAATSSFCELELRYLGQKHSVRIPFPQNVEPNEMQSRFAEAYEARYGHADPHGILEVVGLHVSAVAPTERPTLESLIPYKAEAPGAPIGQRSVFFSELGRRKETPVLLRSGLAPGSSGSGPAVIEEYGATTIVGPHDRYEIGSLGEIRVYCGSAA